MWQRTAVASSAKAAAPWIGFLCTTMAVSMNVNVDGAIVDALFLSPYTIHRAQCDAASSPSSPSSMMQQHQQHVLSPLLTATTIKNDSNSTTRNTNHSTKQLQHNNSNSNSNDTTDNCYERMKTPERGVAEHAIFGTLNGDTLIESYEVFKPTKTASKGRQLQQTTTTTTTNDDNDNGDDNVLIAYVKFGSHLNGHTGVVHGGILSLMFDDIMGFGYEALRRDVDDIPMAVTANLNVDFRKPVLEGTRVRMDVQLERREGRKLFWKARMIDSLDPTILYAEATSLYIIIAPLSPPTPPPPSTSEKNKSQSPNNHSNEQNVGTL